jgi:hypothetical protein
VGTAYENRLLMNRLLERKKTIALRIEDVWYASERTAISSMKTKVVDDVGIISIYEDSSLQFVGKKKSLIVSNVSYVILGRQKIAWKTYLKANLLIWAFCIISNSGWLYFLVMTGIGNAIGGAVFYSTFWCIITYIDETNSKRTIYFADGSYLGYGGAFGGTKKLFNQIDKRILTSDSEGTR